MQIRQNQQHYIKYDDNTKLIKNIIFCQIKAQPYCWI